MKMVKRQARFLYAYKKTYLPLNHLLYILTTLQPFTYPFLSMHTLYFPLGPRETLPGIERIFMSIRRKNLSPHATHSPLSSAIVSETETELCTCPPVSSLCLLSPEQGMYQDYAMQKWDDDHDSILPVHPILNDTLHTHVQALFPAIPSFSVLLLHISQLEHVHIPPETTVVHKRRRYHPAATILEQVMVNVRRAIRDDDLVHLDEGRGAAIIFPDVDRQGILKITERVYNSVNLLQAETLLPPLTHETDIVLGIGSYPEQGPALEQVLASAGRVHYRLTLRPAITTRLWETMPMAEQDVADDTMQSDADSQHEYTSLSTNPLHSGTTNDSAPIDASAQNIIVPFLQLPAQLSTRLKSLIAYDTASHLRCVPVGRDHQRLTVAMADPTDTKAIGTLHELTHLTIFPVACDNNALDTLLETKW